MKLTLLLDLDNTLIGNDMGSFLPVYFKSLSARFPQWPGDSFVKKLLAATQVMVSKNQPELTLEQTFDRVFYPSLGIKKEDAAADLEEFYAGEFGTFHYLTQPRPEAVELVQRAQAKGVDMIVATNPIFPRSAILHRIHWAGFPDEKPFRLVTSFDGFHFSKPHPAYYAEILAQIGCPDQPAIMVGDNLEDDLIPAAKIGIAGFLITDHPVTLPDGLSVPIQQGKLGDVWNWVEQIAGKLTPPSDLHTSQAILATLKATPAALDTICRNLTQEEWQHKPALKEWAITEILCHLRDVDREVNLPRISQLLNEEEPFLPGIETDPWADERHYITQSGPAALAAFMDARAEMTGALHQLPAEGWERLARHAIFGPTNLLELLSFIATHDIVHIRQVFHTLNSVHA
jgi:HAD superfamily hydrolase (TIGR01549 family)